MALNTPISPVRPVPIVEEQVIKKETSNLNDVKITNAEFFYLQMSEDQKLHHIEYNFSYIKTNTNKYAIRLEKAIPKTDDLTFNTTIKSSYYFI